MSSPFKRNRAIRVLVGLAVLAATAGVGAQWAGAVHDQDFQLEGDAVSSTPTNVGGTQAVDWDSLFNADGSTKSLAGTGFDHADLTSDFNTEVNRKGVTVYNTSDSTTFATGSKDTLPITPGWQCSRSNNVLDKDDLNNVYAGSYKGDDVDGDGEGDEFVYFGLDRNGNNGTANVGFWFLQGDVGCTSPGGSVPFSGHHQDGDLLIVSEFSNGGVVSTINVYRWEIPNPTTDPVGALNPTPVAQGSDCRGDANGPLAGGATVCAAANKTQNGTGGTITVPWGTADGTTLGHSLSTSEFFEGGLNLSKANLDGHCFNTFLGNTRSSTSLTATIFDFARGTLGQCTADVTTTPRNEDGTALSSTVIPASGELVVKDRADLDVNGVSSFDGEIEFHLCGPFAAGTTNLCESGGVDLGTVNADGDGSYDSAEATITKVGRYCFRADFSGDAGKGVPEDSDFSAGECFTVTPRTPTLSTQAGAGPVDFGQPVTDTAVLGNTANRPGTGGPSGSTDGSINPAVAGGPSQGVLTFTLKGPNASACGVTASGAGDNPQTVAVSGDDTYGPVSFTPDQPGTYHWVAAYDGDTSNPNTDPFTHNATCTDTNEDVVVRTIPTQIQTKQSWYPNDTATITSSIAGNNLDGGGSVAFSLYSGTECTGTARYTETKVLAGGANAETVSTSNTSFNITTLFTDAADTAVTYSWKVVYTPDADDSAHTGIQSTCSSETFTITYTNDNGPGTAL